jgi:hypothetical protein
MRELLKQIKTGLDHNLYFLSLFVSLTVPDICAAMSSDNGESNGKKYQVWFNRYMVPKNPKKYGDGTNFTAEDCWNFRCAILHQGRSNHGKIAYKRILFFEPNRSVGIFGVHSCAVGTKTKEKSLLIDLKIFCSDMIISAQEWMEENENSEIYKKNERNLVKRYPKGVAPVFGAPVIG